MKICMLAPEFFPVWGGVGTYINELVKHLPSSITIHVVAPIRTDARNKEVLAEKKGPPIFGNNVNIHYISRANDTFFYNAMFQTACLRYVPKLLRDEKIDIIHSHTAHMPDLLLTLRKLKTPIVTTVHTTIKSQHLGTKNSGKNFFELERSEQATSVMYPFLRFAETAYFRHHRFYISPSNWMKRSLEIDYKITEKINVIPNSVDIADFKMNPLLGLGQELRKKRPNTKIILYVGRLIAMKGIDTLLHSIPHIVKEEKLEDFLFVFAGPGNKYLYLAKALELGVAHFCLFTGPLQKEQVVELMKNSDVVVLPSFTENAPYVILESMACGVPVIASNVGGVSEIISDGQNGRLLKAISPKVLATTISELLIDQSLLKIISKAGQETIKKKFSWSVNIEKYCKVYSDALCNEPLERNIV
jgi:glycosyltransferase involved in cell wall biosynthesis